MLNNREFSYAELCEKARGESNQEKKKEGPEFMALRNNVATKHFELAVSKQITPAEDNLLKLLEIKTIGAFKTVDAFYLSDLSAMLGYKEKDKIYKILKSLTAKKIITREKTRNKDLEILGLNPEFFGQILINKLNGKDKKNYLKLIQKKPVDKVENNVDNLSTLRPTYTPDVDTVSSADRHNIPATRTGYPQSALQPLETIEEKPLLDSFKIILDTFRCENAPKETNVSTPKTRTNPLKIMTEEDYRKEKERQLKEFEEFEKKRSSHV